MIRLVQGLVIAVILSLLSSVLAACSSGSVDGERPKNLSAKEMLRADVPLVNPAGPDSLTATPSESPVGDFTFGGGQNPSDQVVEPLTENQLMRIPPSSQPPRFREFSEQGAVNLVAYYTYSTYFSFVAAETKTMRKVFTAECKKCVEMASWADHFISANPQIQTGIPTTEIIDVYKQSSQGQPAIMVVAQNQEPSIMGLGSSGDVKNYDPPSTSKSLYRVQFIDGTNKITGIFQPPAKYL